MHFMVLFKYDIRKIIVANNKNGNFIGTCEQSFKSQYLTKLLWYI